MTIKTDEQATTLAWHKGAFAGKNVWYDDDPYYIYYPADQYEDDLRNGVGSDVADLILNVKDALVKNGAWDIDRAKGTKTSAEVKAEASKFIQQYLGVELEDKNVRSQLFPNTSSAKSAGNTQLSYQIDVKALAQHFVNYWISHEAQYPHLKSWVIQQIEDTGVGDAEGEYRQALDNVRNWDFGTDEEPDMPTITVDLNYGRKRLMSSIAVSVSGKDEYGDSYKGSLSLTLSQQNAVSVDDPDLTDTVSKAKDNNGLDLS